MRHFRPKGITIYRTRPLRRVGQRFQLRAGIKSCGRTGAKVRSMLQRATRAQQQQALDDWSRGHATDVLTEDHQP